MNSLIINMSSIEGLTYILCDDYLFDWICDEEELINNMVESFVDNTEIKKLNRKLKRSSNIHKDKLNLVIHKCVTFYTTQEMIDYCNTNNKNVIEKEAIL